MITYSNIRRFDRMEFPEYRKLDGYSYSWLTREVNGQLPEFEETYKLIIGKLVDAILTDPAKADMRHEHYPIAKSIAARIKASFGPFLKSFEKQISFTGTMSYEGHEMHTMGRFDYGLPGHAVIDLKVTHANDVDKLIKYMGYNDQLWNYCNLYQVRRKYIMIHSVPLGQTFMKDMGVVAPRNEFWEAKILKFGTPMAA